jgi:hypothetical protein
MFSARNGVPWLILTRDDDMGFLDWVLRVELSWVFNMMTWPTQALGFLLHFFI